MKKNNVLEFAGRDAISAPDRFVEIGCQQLICQVVEAELQELLSQYRCSSVTICDSQPDRHLRF